MAERDGVRSYDSPPSRSHSHSYADSGHDEHRENGDRDRKRQSRRRYVGIRSSDDRDRDRDRDDRVERGDRRDRERTESRRSHDRERRSRDYSDRERRHRHQSPSASHNSSASRDRRRSRSRSPSHDRRSHLSSRSRDGGYGHHHDRDRDRDHKDRNYQNRSSREESNRKKQEIQRVEEDEEDYQERVEEQLAAQEEDDVERIKEESRRRRQAILDKYNKQNQQEQQVPEQQQPKVVVDSTPASITVDNSSVLKTGHDLPGVPRTNLEVKAVEQTLYGMGIDVNTRTFVNGNTVNEDVSAANALGQRSPKGELEHSGGDMFCDDIFGESPAGGRRMGKGDGLAINSSGLTDNWDDPEGRYCFRIGEILDGRYDVLASHGSGVFSTVVRAHDSKAGKNDLEEVAIKIIRNNDTMYKIGLQELVILKKLAGADPENRRHCVRLLSSFEYRNHLCLVFESLHMNLREILKKFGRNIGINLTAVRAYAKQLFIALKHLRNCGVLHCDIKPDNMLVNDAMNVLKLCDFGSAMFAGENEITPYLVSRFYRAPEIILGLPYDHALDIWSVGCCLYELYSGKMLFPGHTNNDMLRLHMELKGAFPKKMLKKAQFRDQHFDQDLNFCAVEEDPVTKKMVKRIIRNDHFVKPKDMGHLIFSSGSADEDPRLVAQFRDLLEKMFVLDPDKRMTVSEALNHPFISGR